MHTELIRIATAEIGVREEGANNSGARVRTYQAATWLKPDAWPWCAALTCWVLQQWLATAEGRAYLGNHEPNKWRCRDASAYGWEKWAKQKGLTLLPETQLAKAGDLVVFDFSHIALVVEDQKSLTAAIVTVEGNTNGAGDRESMTGDGVWLKRRKPSLVKNYIRLGDKAP